MRFCENCGKAVSDGAKFCGECGTPIAIASTQHQISFEGKVHKCPNCGEALDSFTRNCPTCGVEIRDVEVSSSVSNFSIQLQSFESQREYEPPQRGLFSLLNTMNHISKTDHQTINLIKGFPIPNTAEDILEFMILATANVNLREFVFFGNSLPAGERAINDAWIAKIKQACQKAELTYGDTMLLNQIKSLSTNLFSSIRREKVKSVLQFFVFDVAFYNDSFNVCFYFFLWKKLNWSFLR